MPTIASLENVINSFHYLVGFFLVIATLAAMWGLCSLIGLYFRGQDKGAAPLSSPDEAPRPAGELPLPDHVLLAVIAAAADSVVRAPVRVVSIRTTSTDWSREGRRQIFGSHRVR